MTPGEDHALFGVLSVVLGEVVAAERGAVARRIGAIVGACQVEALDINGGSGTVPIATVEARLAALAHDVRVGLHGPDIRSASDRRGSSAL